MALSLLCGGLGVAEATVHVNEGTGVTSEVYTTGETYSRELVDEKLNSKANANDVATNTANIANLENNKLSKADASITYATKADVYSKTDAENTFATKTELTAKADATALAGKANTDLSNLTEAGKTAIKTTMTDELAKKADNDTVTVLDGRVGVVEGKVAALETTVSDPSNGLVKKVTDLKTKTTQISFEPAKGTIVNGVDFMAQEVDAHGKGLTGVSTLHTTGAATIGGALTAAGLDAGTGAITGGSLSVTGEVKGNRVDAGSGEIKTTGVVNAGTLSTAGDATVGGNLNATGKVSGNGLDAKTGEIKGGSLSVTGAVTGNSVNAGTLITTGDATVGGDLKVTGETTLSGELKAEKDATFEKNVTVEKDLTVNGKLNVDKISMKNDELKNGKKHDSATTITADEISNLAKVTDEKGNTTESQFTHNKKGTFNYARDGNNADWKESNSNVTADGVSNKMTDSDGNRHTYSQTATESKEQLVNGDKSKSNFEKKTAEGNTISITEKDADGNPKSSLTNTQTVNGEKTSVTNNDSSSTIKQEADQIRHNVTSADGKKSSIEVKAEGITNTSKDGTITNDAKDIENNATGDITNTAQNGSIINKAENGNISNTAQNVTNEGTESVTNKVGKNEVKVSKDGVNIKAEDGKKITESVGTASRVVENDKITDEAGNSTVTTENGKGTTFGKEGIADTTNIYGDSIKTGTINARDTTTGKLTAGAAADVDGGRLTVDADGVKGSYKYGDYTSRSYILANTLQSGVDNGKDITDNGFVGSRTDHYMDGGKAKLNETVKDADGSNVTKKTSTKTYTEIKDTNGNTLSVNQKADGNNYKLEDQDGNTNHVTNSATQSKQTLKDKDGNTLTTNQTATKNNFDLKSADGSKENHTTNTVDESRVAIKGENGKAELSTTDEGTTFKHSAAKEAFTEGGATNTTIKGNTITTGKVTMDYADVMKDLGVKGNTTLGEAGKDTTLTVNSKATFNNGLTVTNGETKLKNTTIEGTLNVFENATFQKDVTANSFSVNGKTYIDSDGLNANNQVIRNVADGSISEGSKDAVNGGQLYNVKNDLEGKVNKVGANAAAMANLHPMEFDPDSKWNIAAAIGNYGSETAAALGAFYRPNDDVMVNLSTAFGTGENMVGGGVSVRLGQGGNKLSREESNALKDQVNDLTARMDALLSVLNPNMSKDFPDVPENHWAYEAVSRLAGNDIVQGYPDGEFHGERTMTRYEMAEIIYNALSRGAEAEKELVEEFKPELQAMAASEKATAERAEG